MTGAHLTAAGSAAAAAAAEQAVVGRHLARLWGLPGTALGFVAWPAGPVARRRATWHYWWQAHLLDCLLDAELRAPHAARRRQIAALARSHRLRNLGVWTNSYYDDMAWLGLALLRAADVAHVDRRGPAAALGRTLASAWDAAPSGGIPWRRRDTFRNAPANGPAALLLARLGDTRRAAAVADWIDARLRDPASGLILDGVRDVEGLEPLIYTYCQGVVLGAELELARLLPDEPRHAARVCRLVTAVADQLAPGGVLVGCGAGDGGLFAGITARYLALVATGLPGDGAAEVGARRTAAHVVASSAAAAWANRQDAQGPLFGTDWSTPAVGVPPDLSVQLSGWMLMEAAAAVSVH